MASAHVTSMLTKADWDLLDAPTFDVSLFINTHFSNEQSLGLLDSFIGTVSKEIAAAEAEIHETVRQQACDGSDPGKEIAQVHGAIEELFGRISSMRAKAAESEDLVQEICRDIRTLDTGKANLTATITALKRLVMFVTALDQLRAAAAVRQYRDAANLMLAIDELAMHFKDFVEVPRIRELTTQRTRLLTELKKQVLEDFAACMDPSQADPSCPNEPSPGFAVLAKALECQGLKDDMLSAFCEKTLAPYQKLFAPGIGDAKPDDIGLGGIERRYAWLRRTLREIEDLPWVKEVFPPEWRVSSHLCADFCRITRDHLVEILGSTYHQTDPKILVKALLKTVEVEEGLERRFNQENEKLRMNPGESPDKAAVASQLTYPEAFREQSDIAGESSAGKTSKSRTLNGFKGLISSSLEPYLGVWVRHEESELTDAMRESVARDEPVFISLGDSWGGKNWKGGADDDDLDFDDDAAADDDAEDKCPLLLRSATEVFSSMQRCLTRAAAVSSRQTLYDITQVFKTLLRMYAEGLKGRLQKIRVAAGMNEDTLRFCGAVLGTSQYCDSTLEDLEGAIKKHISEQYGAKVTFEDEKEIFWEARTEAVQTLVNALASSVEAALSDFSRENWVMRREVESQSPFALRIMSDIQSAYDSASEALSLSYYRFFCERFAQWFIPRFVSGLFSLKAISDLGAQQLLLDACALRSLFLEGPVKATKQKNGRKGGIPVPAGYAKFVSRELGKAEVLLKILSSPVGDMNSIQTFLVRSSDGTEPLATEQEVKRLLALKVATPSADVDDANERQAKESRRRPFLPHAAREKSEPTHAADKERSGGGSLLSQAFSGRRQGAEKGQAQRQAEAAAAALAGLGERAASAALSALPKQHGVDIAASASSAPSGGVAPSSLSSTQPNNAATGEEGRSLPNVSKFLGDMHNTIGEQFKPGHFRDVRKLFGKFGDKEKQQDQGL